MPQLPLLLIGLSGLASLLHSSLFELLLLCVRYELCPQLGGTRALKPFLDFLVSMVVLLRLLTQQFILTR